ncbi:MAG: damage-inducible protein D [Candidatus Zixiibacteriota bacterium]|nr:MAG: damage-inducible protein D [candidate division Zixibacteria bacterium]
MRGFLCIDELANYTQRVITMLENSSSGGRLQTTEFEKMSHKNGGAFWLRSEFMHLLGYDDLVQIRAVTTKAQKVCLNLDIPVEDNFARVDDPNSQDLRLSRFACYLMAMNADSSKPEVAKAQVYLATIAESIRLYQQGVENVARVLIRGDIKQKERSLAGVAKQAEVNQYGLFQNAGYRGMYNMNFAELTAMRSIPNNRSPLDFMGKPELAAHLFRVTQTEERIKNEKIVGQRNCETAAEHVGKQVRRAMIESSGSAPEDLPVAEDIKSVSKQIKNAAKEFKKIDKSKN